MSGYDDAVIADGAVSYWRFDTAAPPFRDSVGSRDIASVSGSGGPALVNSGLGFAGLSLPPGAFLLTSFAFAGATSATYDFFAATSATKLMYATTRGSLPGMDLGLRVGANFPSGPGLLAGGYNGTGVMCNRTSASPYISDSKWRHVAITWQGTGATINTSQFRLYVDGVRVDTADDIYSSTPDTSMTTSALRIGADYDNSAAGGLAVARFAVYNTALTAAQVAAHSALRSVTGVWGWVG